MSEPKTVRFADYRPPDFLVDSVDLDFDLHASGATVRARLAMRRNPAADGQASELRLDGVGLELRGLAIDGAELAPQRYRHENDALHITAPPDRFTLESEVYTRPQDNIALEGLYRSGQTFCTQCEAEGFRKITFYPDRPDVMARFAVTVTADRDTCPVLLANGNETARGELEGGRHWVTWTDPHRKPAYLFALVAGDLACIEDRFVTRSGRAVDLRIYVEHHNADKCEHAMAALVKSMRWDEDVFGLEYDLDIYMIVAVDDFNMGAMENKGLNVFNSKYVLARPETATDGDYANIEGVIAHEYFHNWTGNRVTCRDWFQLSLKEGLTVFRDQEFSADVTSRSVKRIADVRTLRTHQFPQDAGPMAHPVRPDSYIEINNFYTVTVYNKGAEVIRMMHTLLGADAFRAGMDLYFERHDGQAVTTEEFVRAMEDAGGIDLGGFRRWYTQAGTPVVAVAGHYDARSRTYELTLRQSCPATPGQPEKLPFHIPVRMALLDAEGRETALRAGGADLGRETVIELTGVERTVRFEGVDAPPTPSLGRGFSAPVRLDFARDDEQLAFLMAHDSDPFNRWDAAQEYASAVLLRLLDGADVPAPFIDAFARTLDDPRLDLALTAEALTLPSESNIAERMDEVDPDAIHTARRRLRTTIATRLAEPLARRYHGLRSNKPYRFDPADCGARSLKNLCLSYLVSSGTAEADGLCVGQFETADNMTDSLSALACLVDSGSAQREAALTAFRDRWRADPLVLDKWFSLQALGDRPDTLARVEALMRDEAFDLRNPNRVRALVGAFCHGNQVHFNERGGSGYRFLGDRVIELDPINPHTAARLLGALSRWRRFDPQRRDLMRAELERIAGTANLSLDTYEIASKSLA